MVRSIELREDRAVTSHRARALRRVHVPSAQAQARRRLGL
jgi:hypothetical protein